jgi:hypothetical protein
MKQRITNAMITADRAASGFPDYSELADAVLAETAAVDLGPNATLREQWAAMVEAAGR